MFILSWLAQTTAPGQWNALAVQDESFNSDASLSRQGARIAPDDLGGTRVSQGPGFGQDTIEFVLRSDNT
jgi:hypothetical protein